MNANDTNRISDDRLDALFRSWSDDRRSAAPRPLSEWIREHPEASGELVAWAVDERVSGDDADQSADPAIEEITLRAGLSALAELKSRYSDPVAPTPIKSLIATAKAAGLSPRSLADRLDVGLSIVAKLQQRLIRAATVPDELISRLAAAVRADTQQIRDYLALPPTLASSSDYKAAATPRVGEQQEFAEAVRTCSDMSADARDRWIRS